jgi:hypothetical protein
LVGIFPPHDDSITQGRRQNQPELPRPLTQNGARTIVLCARSMIENIRMRVLILSRIVIF